MYDLFLAGSPQEIKFVLNENFYVPLENRTEYESIRLVDGATEFEGRLELNISGEFGTVCNDVSCFLDSLVSVCIFMNNCFDLNLLTLCLLMFSLA